MTVFGKPIVLPKLEAPRPEDVDKWHATYVEVRRPVHGDFEFELEIGTVGYGSHPVYIITRNPQV